jgi:hypothetical protein
MYRCPFIFASIFLSVETGDVDNDKGEGIDSIDTYGGAYWPYCCALALHTGAIFSSPPSWTKALFVRTRR